MRTNPGKAFEQDFFKSVPPPPEAYGYRLKDAAGWGESVQTRFTVTNDYDFLIYSRGIYLALELKSVGGTSWPYKSLRKNQEKGLLRAAATAGAHAGVVLNFRKYASTFYLPIIRLLDLRERSPRKSVNLADAEDIGYRIHQNMVRTRYRYDIEYFLRGLVD